MDEMNTRQVKLVTTAGASAPVADFQRSLAVVIGINDYRQGIPPLRTARADAERLAQILTDHHAYETLLYTEDVTSARLISLLQHDLPQQVGGNDRLLFYFAGHGIALDGDDGPAGYLVPQDAQINVRDSFLPMQIVHDALTALACRHCLVILDCCFSGAFRWSSTRNVAAPPKTLYRERYERFLRSPAWQVLTSAAYDQEALDMLVGAGLGSRDTVVEAGVHHSPFALALFDALTGNGETSSDANRDGVVAATELYLYLRDSVEVRAKAEARHWQTPGLWPLQKHDKGEYIFLLGEPDLPPAPELTAATNPYRGLASYDADDAELFFGRQALIKTLAERVETQPLTVVLGASGTGKSSIVKAGVAPYLTGAVHREPTQTSHPTGTGAQPAPVSTPWHALPPLRPTETPLQALTELIAEHLPGSAELAGATTGTAEIETHIADWLATHPDQKLLLIVDQFEELVTLCRDALARETFQQLLQRLLDKHPEQLRLILTLRTDFEPQFAASPLADRWQQGRFIVPPMTQAELRTVIEGPAGVRVLFFEPPGLVDQLIDEVIQTPGALPLLSFTLEQLYLKYLKRQTAAQAVGDTIERALTGADYLDLGGVIGSLRTRADEEYKTLPDDAHRATMERVMLRMIAIEGGELARRRVPMTELVYPSAEENARVATVIERLVVARLLVMDSADADGDGMADAYVEPAHDALVRAWDRLLRWKQGFEEYLSLQRTLTAAAEGWKQERAESNSGLLWNNNPRLPQLQSVLFPDEFGENQNGNFLRTARQSLWPPTKVTDEPTWLNHQETEFVRTSVVKRANVLKRIVGIAIIVLVSLSGLALVANNQRILANQSAEEADTERDNAVKAGETAIANANARATEVVIRSTAEAEAVAAEATAVAEAAIARSRELANQSSSLHNTNPELALMLALEAGYSYSTLEASIRLRTIAEQPGYVINSYYNNTDTDIDHIVEAKWNKDNSKLLIVSIEKTVSIRELESGAEVFVILPEHTEELHSVDWDSSGTKILIGSRDAISVWDVNTQQRLHYLQSQDSKFSSASWSPSGSKIIVLHDNTSISIWNTDNGKKYVLPHPINYVRQLVWDRNESNVYFHDSSNGPQVWNLDNNSQTFIFPDSNQVFELLEWNQDASRLLSVASTGITIWEVQTGQAVATINTYGRKINSAAWTKDSSSVLIYDDRVLEVWKAETGEKISSFENADGNIQFASWNPLGSKILFVSNSNSSSTLYMLDAASGNIDLMYPADTDIYSASWSFDGSRILAQGDQTLNVWQLNKLNQPISLSGVYITTVDWSKEGSKILIYDRGFPMANISPSVKVWNLNRSKLPITIEHKWPIQRAIWSSDESQVLTYSNNQSNATLWDAETGNKIDDLVGNELPDFHEGRIAPVAFCEDDNNSKTRNCNGECGEYMNSAGGSMGESVNATWNAENSRLLTHLCCVPQGGADNIIRIWDSESGDLVQTLEGHTGNGVRQAVWSQDSQKVLTHGSDGTMRVWDVETGNELIVMRGVHGLPVNAIWSPNESKIFIGGFGEPEIWDAVTGNKLVELQVFAPVNVDGSFNWITTGQAVWNQSGTRVMACVSDGNVNIWNITMESQIQTFCEKRPRNLSREEWELYMHSRPYHPTCVQSPIPPGVIKQITDDAKSLAQNGDLVAAAERLGELVHWLRLNGQFNNFGVERTAWLAVLETGENPWAEE